MNCLDPYQIEKSFDSSYETSSFNITFEPQPQNMKSLSFLVPYTLFSDDSIQLQDTKYEIQKVNKFPPFNIYENYQTGDQSNDLPKANEAGPNTSREDKGRIPEDNSQIPQIFSRQALSDENDTNYEYDNFNRILGEIFPPQTIDQVDNKTLRSGADDGFQEKIKPEVLSVERMKRNQSCHKSRKHPQDDKSSDKIIAVEPSANEDTTDDAEIITAEPSKAKKGDEKHTGGAKSISFNEGKDAQTKKGLGDGGSLSVAPLEPSSLMHLIDNQPNKNSNQKNSDVKDQNLNPNLSTRTKDPNLTIRNYSDSEDQHLKDPNVSIRRHPDAEDKKRSRFNKRGKKKLQGSVHPQTEKAVAGRRPSSERCEKILCPYNRDRGYVNDSGSRSSLLKHNNNEDFRDRDGGVSPSSLQKRQRKDGGSSLRNKSSQYKQLGNDVEGGSKSSSGRSLEEPRKNGTGSHSCVLKQQQRDGGSGSISFVDAEEVEVGSHKFDGKFRCDSKFCPSGNTYKTNESFKEDDDTATIRSSKTVQNQDVTPIRSITTQASPEVSATGTQYTAETPKTNKSKKSGCRKKTRGNQTGSEKREISTNVKCNCRDCKIRTYDVYIPTGQEDFASSKISLDSKREHAESKKKYMLPKIHLGKKKKICVCKQDGNTVCACRPSKKHGIKGSDGAYTSQPNDDFYRNNSRANQAGDHNERNAYRISDPIVTLEDGVQICAVKVNVVDRNRYIKEQRNGRNIFQSLFYTYHSSQVPRMKWSSIWPFGKAKKKSKQQLREKQQNIT